MKNLDLFQEVDSPESEQKHLGIVMDTESSLAIGIVSGVGGYSPPGVAGTIGGTAAGNLWGISSGE